MPIISDRLGDEDDLATGAVHFYSMPGKPAEDDAAQDEAQEDDAAWMARHRAAGWTTYYCGEPEDKLGPAPPDADA